MTIEEAIKYLENPTGNPKKHEEATKIAIMSMQFIAGVEPFDNTKGNPHPVKKDPAAFWPYHCPKCGSYVISTDKFCHECGTKLEWEE